MNSTSKDFRRWLLFLGLLSLPVFGHPIKARGDSFFNSLAIYPTDRPTVSPCENLYEASCGGKSNNKLGKLIKRALKNDIREARDRTARILGFKNFRDAVNDRLAQAGIKLVKNSNSKKLRKEWSVIFLGASGESSAGDLFSVAKRCGKFSNQFLNDADKIQAGFENQIATKDKTANAESLEAEIKHFKRKYQELDRQFIADDIPDFVTNITNQCQTFRSSPKSYPLNLNQKATQVCRNLSDIERRAAELYRTDTSPESPKTIAFITKNKFSLQYSDEDSAAKSITDQINNDASDLSDICGDLSNDEQSAATSIASKFIRELSTSKPTVDYMIAKVYAPSQKKIALKMFDEVKQQIKQFVVANFHISAAKRERILNSYNRLAFEWFRPLPNSIYIKNKDTGLPTINSASRLLNNPETAAEAEMFMDPSLSEFTTVNSYYSAFSSTGIYREPAMVHLLPMVLMALKSNPYMVLTVLAHEAGHNIGPDVSAQSGYDLTSQYTNLLACYESKRSIRRRSNQRDEVVADYISSEVLARVIAGLPKNKR